MSLKKYRADVADEPCPNGSIAWRSNWRFGPSLALVKQCPVRELNLVRTVYVRGEPELWFCHPAACTVKGMTVRGGLYRDDEGYYFQPYAP